MNNSIDTTDDRDRPRLPADRPGRAAPPPLLESRAQMATAAAAGIWKTARPPIEERMGDVRVLRYLPSTEPTGYVVHFHGGGFRLGLPEYAGPYAAALADRCGVEVIVPQYRLAPEHPFPAGVRDALAVLTAVTVSARGHPVIASGDSAGGGLAASLTTLCVSSREPRLDGLVLHSPWLDLTISAQSYDTNAAADPLFSRASAEEAAELYLQGFPPIHTLASPLFASITDWPPTLISVGTGEVLFDDSRLFHEKLCAAGVVSTLRQVYGMDHVAVLRGIEFPGARETFDAVARFLDHILREESGESGMA